ncbi:MAG: hypothetical protein GVY08_00515 [Bacteroidetes bacterium]|jgi:uncharacterized surface protein with fasciclin (FAS1) repeats|nr:hypothetical protein [Bacteroidota bacterium]
MKPSSYSAFTASFFTLLLALLFSINTAFAQDSNVVEIINSSENHTIFSELLAESSMDETISSDGPFTVIAPTDEAFKALGDELAALRENPDDLLNIVIAHLFQGEVSAADVEPALGITITEGDIQASNGVVHITNEVIQ